MTEPVELQQEFNFTIYPNPMKDKSILQVTSSHVLDGCTLLVYDFQGGKVMEMTALTGSRLELDAASFNDGIYICLLVDEQGHELANHKLVVE